MLRAVTLLVVLGAAATCGALVTWTASRFEVRFRAGFGDDGADAVAELASRRFKSGVPRGQAVTLERLPLRLRLQRGQTYVLNESTTRVARTYLLHGASAWHAARHGGRGDDDRDDGDRRQHHRHRIHDDVRDDPVDPVDSDPAVDDWAPPAEEMLATASWESNVALELRVRGGQERFPELDDGDVRCRVRMLDFLAFRSVTDSDELAPTDAVFRSVQDATRGVEFDVTLASDGTVRSMDSFELRRVILDGLHRVGRLPVRMEHAVRVGDAVFPANGATFDPVGVRRVDAPITRVRGFGCTREEVAAARPRGFALVVDRGQCTFQHKAQLAVESGAAALVVVEADLDLGAQSGDADAVSTYMSGDSPVPIVTVIVSRTAGRAIDEAVVRRAAAVDAADADADADADASTPMLTVLGGVDAVLALHESRAGSVAATAATAPDARGAASARWRLHDLAHGDELEDPAQSSHERRSGARDGLVDVVGAEFVVEEMIRMRFSIFPTRPVAYNERWVRSEMITNPANPTGERAVMDEAYTLLQTSVAPAAMHGVRRSGDLFADIGFEGSERGGVPGTAPRSKWRRGHGGHLRGSAADAEVGGAVQPMFGRPSLRGEHVRMHGQFHVHAGTGWMAFGRVSSWSSSYRRTLANDRVTGEPLEVPTRVHIATETEMWGGVGPESP